MTKALTPKEMSKGQFGYNKFYLYSITETVIHVTAHIDVQAD